MNRNMEAVVWAMNAKGMSPGAYRVLVNLARRVGKRGFDVWPSHKKLGDDVEMSVSSVRRYLAEIEALGLVDVIAQYDDRGDRRSNIYRLQVRQKMQFPGQPDLQIEPDDDDGDLPLPPAAGEQGVRRRRTDPLLADEQTPLFAGEQAEPIQERTIQEEPDSGDFGKSPVVVGDALDVVQFVEQAWKSLTDENRGIAAARKIDAGLAHTIRMRATEHARKDETPIDVWTQAIAEVRASRFLRGLAPPGRDRSGPFRLSLAWMTKAGHFREIIGGKYRDTKPATDSPDFDAVTGRRYSTTDKALNAAKSRLHATRGRGGARDRGAGDYPRIAG